MYYMRYNWTNLNAQRNIAFVENFQKVIEFVKYIYKYSTLFQTIPILPFKYIMIIDQ